MELDQSTGAPTGEQTGVTSPTPATLSPVNPAQTLPPTTTTAQPPVDISATINNYEGRIRALMSEKDKAINERDRAIAKQVELQQQLTQLQEQMGSNMTASANTAQAAIDETTRLKAQVSALSGELMRYQTLQAHPELMDYVEFLPATTDAEAMAAQVSKLMTVRNKDLDRLRAQYPGQQQVPPTPPLTGQNPTAPGTPVTPNPYGLYAGRPNMFPQVQVPASSPSMMNPAGASTNVEAMEDMLRKAVQSGDSAAYEEAMTRAKAALPTLVNQQLGRA